MEEREACSHPLQIRRGWEEMICPKHNETKAQVYRNVWVCRSCDLRERRMNVIGLWLQLPLIPFLFLVLAVWGFFEVAKELFMSAWRNR